jgi:hypothetical protein
MTMTQAFWLRAFRTYSFWKYGPWMDVPACGDWVYHELAKRAGVRSI